jgi:hypothetical protein
MDIEEFAEPVEDPMVEEMREAMSERLEELESRTKHMTGREGRITRKVEHVTSALPSSIWLALAGIAMGGSLALRMSGRDKASDFVAQLAPTFLLFGIYNKLVKVAGSDRFNVE